MEYAQKEFSIGELEGLSQKQIETHLGLYAGYVKNTNGLMAELEAYKGTEGNDRAVSELHRRFGFEFNGMRLHELYFEQFESSHEADNGLKAAIEAKWGSFDVWEKDLRSIAKLRGVGWALLVQDARTCGLMNVWVSDHEVGHLGGQPVLMALDVWEHAFLVDYMPNERGVYIDAFFKNLNWGAVEGRYRV